MVRRQRRNAYRAALMIFSGAAIVCLAVVLPALTVKASFSASAYHLSLTPSGGVDGSLAAPIVWVACLTMLIPIIGLAMTRRRGWGIVWRLSALLLALFPLLVAVDLWSDVIDPQRIPKDDLASPPAKILELIDGLLGGFYQIVSVSPAYGLWLLSLGCLMLIGGLTLPSKKTNEIVLRENDPGYQAYGNAWFYNPPPDFPSEAPPYGRPGAPPYKQRKTPSRPDDGYPQTW